MIDVLQNLVFMNLDLLLLSIKKPINQHSLAFIYILSFLVNRQLPSKNQRLICNIHTENDDGFLRFGKLTKTLLHLPIFTNKKYPSIDK